MEFKGVRKSSGINQFLILYNKMYGEIHIPDINVYTHFNTKNSVGNTI